MTALADRPVPASGAPAVAPGLPHVDLLRLRDRLESAERARLDAIEDHLQTRVRPHLTRYWDAEEFAFDLLPGLAELGLGASSWTARPRCSSSSCTRRSPGWTCPCPPSWASTTSSTSA